MFCSFSFLFIFDCNFGNVCKQISFVLFVVNCATFYLHIYLAFIKIIRMGDFFLFILFAEKKDVDAYWLQFSLENISRDNCLDHGTHRYTRTHTNTRDALQRTTRANKWANDFDFNEPTSRRTEELTNQRRTKLTNRFCISYFYLMAPKWDTQTPLDPRLVCVSVCVLWIMLIFAFRLRAKFRQLLRVS